MVPSSSDPKPRRRLLVVDDHDLVRTGLRLVLEEVLGHDVTDAPDGETAIHLVQESTFDVVLLDIRMPRMDGIETLRQIRSIRADLPVVMLTTFNERDTIERAIGAGASGFMLKEATTDQLGEAIETAIGRGGLLLHPKSAQELHTPSFTVGDDLTDREMTVLALLVSGSTNAEIADSLSIAEKTVRTHLTSVFRKLGVKNRTQAASLALRAQIVDQQA